MAKKTELLITTLFLVAACSPGEPGEPGEEPGSLPLDPIGGELMRVIGAWSDCSGGLHLYRQGREVQRQCFGSDGGLSSQSQATLTAEAAATLDGLLADADLSDTEPVNHKGLCGAAEAAGTVTLWVKGKALSFEQNCLLAGIVGLYEHLESIGTELSACGEGSPELLASIEASCGS